MGKVADLLTRARARMSAAEWGKNEYKSERGAYCAVGALYDEAGQIDANNYHERPEPPDEAVDQAEALLAESLPFNRHVVEYWNDRDARGKADVMALYDRAIALATERGL